MQANTLCIKKGERTKISTPILNKNEYEELGKDTLINDLTTISIIYI